MKSLPKKLEKKLNIRKSTNALRSLPVDINEKIDFISNDYLGLGQCEILFEKTHQMLLANNLKHNGSTGSRLISGNHKLYKALENQLSQFYKAQDALVYNSGYNANIGLFASDALRSLSLPRKIRYGNLTPRLKNIPAEDNCKSIQGQNRR